MTPEAQRIAIAEACGIELQRCVRPRQYVTADMAMDAGDRSMEGSLYSEEEWEQIEPPDYLNDLNAMHEAEKVLGEFGSKIWAQYARNIRKGDIVALSGELIHATAAQRAEAFLRTLGLWK